MVSWSEMMASYKRRAAFGAEELIGGTIAGTIVAGVSAMIAQTYNLGKQVVDSEKAVASHGSAIADVAVKASDEIQEIYSIAASELEKTVTNKPANIATPSEIINGYNQVGNMQGMAGFVNAALESDATNTSQKNILSHAVENSTRVELQATETMHRLRDQQATIRQQSEQMLDEVIAGAPGSEQVSALSTNQKLAIGGIALAAAGLVMAGINAQKTQRDHAQARSELYQLELERNPAKQNEQVQRILAERQPAESGEFARRVSAQEAAGVEAFR